jgi:peptidoglycan/LPS O-acetylase OafA/YrhL
LTRLWIVLLPALLIGFALDKFGMLHFAGLHTIYDGPTGQTMVLPHLADRLTPATLGANAIFSQNILTTTLGSNIALWSLTNEFWYYLLFPFALLAIWPGMKAITRIVSAVLFVGILIYVGREIAEYFLLWLFGAGVACLPLVKITPQKAALFSVVVVVIYAITLVGQRKLHLPYFLNDFVASVAFSLMLFGLLHNTGAAKQGIGFHLSRFGAGMSYSLYLTHLPIIVLIVAATIHPWHEYASFKASLPMLAVVIVAALAFAAAFWFLFESRTPALRKWITKQLATD